MHDVLRERIRRHLDALPEERLYQVLDYIEFLTSKYAREGVQPAASPMQRFGERLEDKLRGQRVGVDAIRGTLEVMGTADRMMSGLKEVGRSLLREVGASDAGDERPAKKPDSRPTLRPGTGSEDIPADG